VVDGRNNVELEFAIGTGGEHSGVDFDFLHAGAVQFFERGDYASLLAGSRWSIDEQMGEISAGCLWWWWSVVGVMRFLVRTKALRRCERFGWYESDSRFFGRYLSTRRAILIDVKVALTLEIVAILISF